MGSVDAKGTLEFGFGFAVSVFMLIVLGPTVLSAMFSPDAQSTVEGTKTVVRAFYAFTMVVAPTTLTAILIDVGAAIVATFGFVKSASSDFKTALVGSALICFSISLTLNYAAAPF